MTGIRRAAPGRPIVARRPHCHGTRPPLPASPRWPDGAPRGTDPGPAGSASAAPPTSAGSLPRLPAGRLRDAQDVPGPGRGHPRGGSLQQLRLVERRHVQAPDQQYHGRTAPPPQPQSTPYGGVTYVDPGKNPPVDTGEDHVSTFAMDVDTASYTIAQRYVDDGNIPDPASVRVEEWVNAFDQGYPAPEDGTFAVTVDGAPTPVRQPGPRPAPDRDQGARIDREDPPERRAHLRDRHVGLDGHRRPPRARQGFAAQAGRWPRPGRLDRGRHVR